MIVKIFIIACYLRIMDINGNIRRIRESKGITQSDMAEKFGSTQSNYAYLESRGNKLTIEQLEKIAGALGVSVMELMTGEPQKVEDTDKVRELENQVRQLDEMVKLYQDNSQMKERELDKVKEYFTKSIYNEIADAVFEEGFSKARVYSKVTGKKLASGDKQELINLYKEQLIENQKKQLREFLLNETRSEFKARWAEELFQLESGNLGETASLFGFRWTLAQIIGKHFNLDPWQIHMEFVLLDKFKQKAVNNYFYNLLGEFGGDNKLELIFESGIITDKTLLTSYQRVKYLDQEDIEEGYEINRDLEIVKEIDRKRLDSNQPR